MFLRHQLYFPGEVKLFFFDMPTERWFQCRVMSHAPLTTKWVEVVPPSPSSFTRWAGIGSRDISGAGKDAIRRCFD